MMNLEMSRLSLWALDAAAVAARLGIAVGGIIAAAAVALALSVAFWSISSASCRAFLWRLKM